MLQRAKTERRARSWPAAMIGCLSCSGLLILVVAWPREVNADGVDVHGGNVAGTAERAAPSKTADQVLVTLRCAPRVGKGRVLCDADLTVKSGRLSWADVIITEAPSFAPPLRDRVGMRAASERSATHLRLSFALIAQQAGEGQVTIKARGVWCTPAAGSQELCVAVTKTARGGVIVTELGG